MSNYDEIRDQIYAMLEDLEYEAGYDTYGTQIVNAEWVRDRLDTMLAT